jgi:hypothetical protein
LVEHVCIAAAGTRITSTIERAFLGFGGMGRSGLVIGASCAIDAVCIVIARTIAPNTCLCNMNPIVATEKISVSVGQLSVKAFKLRGKIIRVAIL